MDVTVGFQWVIFRQFFAPRTGKLVRIEAAESRFAPLEECPETPRKRPLGVVN